MKKITTLSFLMLLLFTFVSCEESTEEKILGEWALVQKDGEDVNDDMTIILHEDGKYEGYGNGELMLEANWEVKEDQLVLSKDGESMSFKIKKLDRGILILVEDLGEYGERELEFMWIQ